MKNKAKETTLVQIEKGHQYLMMHRTKKEQDVNADKWIGIGGHFEEGESPEECALREVKEETGLTLTKYKFRGIVTFCYNEPNEENRQAYEKHEKLTYNTCEYMHLFTAHGFEGELASDCDEGELAWIDKKELLTKPIWEGDRLIYLLLDEEKNFFSLKLGYLGEHLVEASLNGEPLELLDIRDEKGALTGQSRARVLAHRDGTIHGTSHVWIARKNEKGETELLLQKRSAYKDAFPGCYDISSAGHIPAGYDYKESALRELEEELGIHANEEELTFVGMHDGKWKGSFYHKPFYNHEISAVYIYEKPVHKKELHLQESEVASVKWMSYKKVLKAAKTEEPGFCLFYDEILMLPFEQ